MSFKDDLIEYKCLCCNKNYQNKFDEIKKKIKKNADTYRFSNHDIKFILLQTGVYSYEYIDDWEKFNGASLTDFYSNLNMEEVRAGADADCPLTKKFVKILK